MRGGAGVSFYQLAREGSDDERVSTITFGSLAGSDKNRVIFGSENKFEPIASSTNFLSRKKCLFL